MDYLTKEMDPKIAMIIDKYGIRLVRLTENDIELVRNWRNDPKIVQYMAFRDYITPEMQKKWFDSVNNENNYFFLIEHEGANVGMTDIKKIDYSARSAELGIFIYDDRYLNSILPYQVILTTLEFAFQDLGLTAIYSHILKTNLRAIRFNISLGFEIQSNQEHLEHQLYMLTKEAFEEKSKKIRDTILKLI